MYIYEMNKLKILGCCSEFHVSLDDHQTTECVCVCVCVWCGYVYMYICMYVCMYTYKTYVRTPTLLKRDKTK